MTKLTDHEINVAVAKLEGSYISPESHINNYREHVPDYANDWALTGPIMQENRVSLECLYSAKTEDNQIWKASQYLIFHEDENPLRAILIVYLNIKGVL